MIQQERLFEGQSPAEIILWAGVAACLLFSLISISIVQVFLGLAIVVWTILLIQGRRRLEVPGFMWPLLVYIAWSLLASALSRDPATSFIECRKLLLALIVPVVMAAYFSARSLTLGILALPLSALAASLFSVVHYFVHHAPGERAKGFMGHYMTQAGLLMIFGAAALALVLFGRDRSRWLWALAFALSLPALGLTLTRSAWIGLVAAACVLVLLYKPKALLVLPLIVGLFFLLGTQAMKRRALSAFSLSGPSNQARIEYFRAGLRIIGENPVHGTGPHTVSKVFQYPEYGLSEQAKKNVHLHSNLLQIAAERGLPALAAWLAFLIWALVDASKIFRAGDPTHRALAAVSMSVLVALFVCGLFEYNFGDSEIANLFFILITLPFARRSLALRHKGSKGQVAR
jgi:O-antigen ligase